MTMQATARPVRVQPADVHVCFRCGIEWTDSRFKFKRGAPCTDCRDPLEREGTDWIGEYVQDRFLEEARRGEKIRADARKRKEDAA